LLGACGLEGICFVNHCQRILGAVQFRTLLARFERQIRRRFEIVSRWMPVSSAILEIGTFNSVFAS
jgi:hypothetical protein